MKSWICITCGLVIQTFFLVFVYGQEIEPRNYAVVPKNMNLVALGYSVSHGNVVADPTAYIQGLVITTSAVSVVYLHTFSFFKKLVKIQVTQPFVFMNGIAKVNDKDTAGVRTGFSDARIRIGINLLGSPAMAMKDFQRFREETVLGVSVVFSVPVGQYYTDKRINIGSNRWGIKPEFGFSKRQGAWYFETYAGVWFFTPNNQFLDTSTVKTNPLLSFQGHICYYFKKGTWISVNGGYIAGSLTTLDGAPRNDNQSNFRMGASLSFPITRKQSLKFLFNTSLSTRAGPNYTAISAIYQYSWF